MYNGVLFGIAEVLSIFLSNLLLLRLDDILAYKVVFSVGAVSYGILIVYHSLENSILTYAAIVALVGSIGARMNINLLIVELRVPPNNVAAVLLLTRTIAVSSCILSPFITSFEAPFPYIILLCFSFLAFIAASLLPPPGHHLPKVTETKDSNMQMLDDTDNPTMLNDVD